MRKKSWKLMNHGELFGKLMIQDILRNIWESYHIIESCNNIFNNIFINIGNN